MYHLDITISNDLGELLDTRRSFDSIDEVNVFMTDATKMHELWCEAETNGKEDGMLDTYPSKEDAELSKEDII